MRQIVASLKEREAWARGVIADDLSPTTKLIGWRLALYLNLHSGRCNPANSTLARELGILERSAKRAVRALERAGWLVVERTRGGAYSQTNKFKLVMRAPGVSPGSRVSLRSRVSPGSSRGVLGVQTGVSLGTPKQRKENREKGTDYIRDLPAPFGLQKTEDAFAAFWNAFPKKVGRIKARKAFAAAIKGGAAPDALVEATKRYAGERAGQDQRYTKHPAAWLSDGRWLDEQPQRHNGPLIDQDGKPIAEPAAKDRWDMATENILKGPR